MEICVNYILIGVFMVVILIGVFGFVYWFVVIVEFCQNVEVKIFYLGLVIGLLVGGQVLFNGIKVGDVSFLDFVLDDFIKVLVMVWINLVMLLWEDIKVMLNFIGLIGVVYVDLMGGISNFLLLFDFNGQ